MTTSAAKQATTKFSASVANATAAAAEALAAKAPKSVLSIPTSVRHGSVPLSELADSNGRLPGAAIRQVGATRRVFLLDPNGHLNTEEMEGLAYRIKMLTKNTGLNSILCANSIVQDKDNDGSGSGDSINPITPASVLDVDADMDEEELFAFPKSSDQLPLAACGYDPRAMHTLPPPQKRKTLHALTKLAKAVKGNTPNTVGGNSDDHTTKIPFITVPHGITQDGGYALSMGSYVLATPYSRFQIAHPSRGLSFDPIGLSYILPRLGWEFQQPSANYPVGMLLALTGYEADEGDMVETGLATHYMDSFGKLGAVERALANLAPYDQQNLLKEPTRKHGDSGAAASSSGSRSRMQQQGDINAKFRNVAVAGLLHSISTYDAMGQEITSARDQASFLADEDPTLVLEGDRGQMFGDRESMLLNLAASFQDVFEKESSVEGIMERMREYASADAKNEEEMDFVSAAADILKGMEAQSPLALCATHKLMIDGKAPKESLNSCIKRELKVQLKLMEKDDFKNWADSGVKEGEFQDWKHKSVKDVTKDELASLFRDS